MAALNFDHWTQSIAIELMHHGSFELWRTKKKTCNSWTDDPQHDKMPLEFPNSKTASQEVYNGPSISNNMS